MELALALGLLIVVLIVVIGKRRQQQQAEETPTKPLKPFAAVKIRPVKHHCCDAAYEASFKTFLVSEAPTLPLRDCGQPAECRCSYVHYDDRRHSSRRSANIQTNNLNIEGYPIEREQRKGSRRGRRKTD